MAEEKHITPVKAIRKYCLGCSNGSSNEVKLCPITKCELYEYRLGHNPARQGHGRKDAFTKKHDTTNDFDGAMNAPEEVTD